MGHLARNAVEKALDAWVAQALSGSFDCGGESVAFAQDDGFSGVLILGCCRWFGWMAISSRRGWG